MQRIKQTPYEINTTSFKLISLLQSLDNNLPFFQNSNPKKRHIFFRVFGDMSPPSDRPKNPKKAFNFASWRIRRHLHSWSSDVLRKNHAHWKIASLVGGWATQLKNIISSTWIISPYLGVKMKHIWNHLFVVNDSNLSLPLEIQNLAPTKSQEFVARDVFLECKRRC